MTSTLDTWDEPSLLEALAYDPAEVHELERCAVEGG